MESEAESVRKAKELTCRAVTFERSACRDSFIPGVTIFPAATEGSVQTRAGRLSVGVFEDRSRF